MRFYTGSYTRMGGPGVGVCHWNNGDITLINTYHDVNDPTYVLLSKDARTLYAAGSLPENAKGALVSYRVDGDKLKIQSCQLTGGKASCHIAESPDGRYLYVANYLGGSVSVFPALNGILGERIQLVEHAGNGAHPVRQEAAHVHQCVFRPGTNELFVCDLGTDQVVIYDQIPQTGLLIRKNTIAMPSGMGPRHLVFADADRFYVTGELDNMVRYIVNDGCWRNADEISTLPHGWSGDSTSAAIRIHEGALWVSNRGHDTLCKIELDSTGKMIGTSWIETGGRIPRDFIFVPEGILFAHQAGGGIISSTGTTISMDGAVCICLDYTTL